MTCLTVPSPCPFSDSAFVLEEDSPSLHSFFEKCSYFSLWPDTDFFFSLLGKHPFTGGLGWSYVCQQSDSVLTAPQPVPVAHRECYAVITQPVFNTRIWVWTLWSLSLVSLTDFPLSFFRCQVHLFPTVPILLLISQDVSLRAQAWGPHISLGPVTVNVLEMIYTKH